MSDGSFDSVSNGNLTLQALRQTLQQQAVTYSGVPQVQQAAQAATAPSGQVELETPAPGTDGGSPDPHRGHLVNVSS